MTWFQDLTGVRENSPEEVRERLYVEGRRLHSRANGKSWVWGELETPTLAELRAGVRAIGYEPRPTSVREIVANVQHLHREKENAGALFQVASQFNVLEMTSPRVTPEDGVGIYENDFTQGPACAIAAGAGTIYRNYFAPVGGRVGQSADNQIDCLADVGQQLGNSAGRLWRMTNGYALASAEGLEEIGEKLEAMDETQRDEIRHSLRIGLQWETEVTLDGAGHTVSQAYCSALPVAYSRHDPELWAPLATIVLEAAYEATLCAAILNRERTASGTLFLTLLGGGAFGNDVDWIIGAARRALHLYSDRGLDVAFVSYRRPHPRVQELVREF